MNTQLNMFLAMTLCALGSGDTASAQALPPTIWVLNRFGEAQSGASESWSQPRNSI